MRFNNHWQLDGKHAFLGASKYHWINYDMEKLERIWHNQFKSEKGTRLHKLAAMLIKEGVRLGRNKITLNMYVNDAIGFKMEPEVVLFYSDNCFGTADAIKFEKGVLRVHDLKTGIHPGSVFQILIYFALFCLEYGYNPYDIEMIGRIYQNDEFQEFIGDPSQIRDIMNKIIDYDKRIDEMREVML